MEPVGNSLASILQELVAATRRHRLILLDIEWETAKHQAYADGAIMDTMIAGGFMARERKDRFSEYLQRKEAQWTSLYSQAESDLAESSASGSGPNGGGQFSNMASLPDGEFGTTCLRFVMTYSHLPLKRRLNLLPKRPKASTPTPSHS